MLDRLADISHPFMDRLSPKGVQAVKNAAISMRYVDGELVHNRGDEKPGLSIVRSGVVRIGVIRPDGTFALTSLLGPGQTFGEFTLFAGLPRTHDIVAQGDTEIWQLPGDRFLNLCEKHTELTQALLATSLVRSHTLLELIEAMRSLPVLERVAKTLVIMVTAAGRSKNYYTRQSDLAISLGISRTTLSKALMTLERDGLVSRGYGKIHLPDRERLIKWVSARDS